MKHTDHHKALLHNPDVLVVFTGAHSYISASWYTDKQQASTWNYMSVHARGPLHFGDKDALLHILQRTTDHFENNADSGANFKDIPAEYVEKLANAIVAFEIEVASLEHVFKLSQNRDEKSFQTIMSKLEAQDADGREIAGEMKKRIPQLFKSK
jgi:transcriptional regulator